MNDQLQSFPFLILQATHLENSSIASDAAVWNWLNVISHLTSFCVYTTIACLVLYFLKRRPDFPYRSLASLIVGAIFLNGLIDLFEALMVWFPLYRFNAVVKLVGAVAGWMAILALFPLVPTLLRMRLPQVLAKEVSERTRELHVAEQLLVNKDQRLTLSLALGKMGTWELNILKGTIQMDSSSLELFGLSAQGEKISIEDFLKLLHEDDRDQFESAIRKTIQDGEPFQHPFQVLTQFQGYRWFETRGFGVKDSQGSVTGIVGAYFDVTERLQREEWSRLVNRAIEYATSGIFICDLRQPNYPTIYVNPAFESLTGYQSEEVVGRGCQFLNGAETCVESIQKLDEAMKTHTEFQVTILHYRKDGSTFWNNLVISPIENDFGVVTHLVGVQNDISDRVSYENNLIDSQKQAETANEAKSEFLANMSHEIRTPLTAILGCAETLCQDLVGDSSRETAKMIRSQGELLLGLLNDILDLSKIEAGKLEVQQSPCELVEIINEVRELTETYAGEKTIQVDVEYIDPLPQFIQTDPLRFRQILLNLSSNAIKFTPSGGRVTLRISADLTQHPPRLRIDVTDTGVGIAAEHLNQIFEAFTQLDNKSHRKFGGTGLGLTILKHLLNMLDGQVTVTSQVGVGSVFTIFLPISEQDFFLAEELRNRNVEKESKGDLDIYVPARVLIAEDTRAIQYMLKRYLQNTVAEIVTVDNGKEAVDCVVSEIQSGKKFDIILMDMQMPLINGYEATKILREMQIDTPVIALTAGAMAGDKSRCLEVGCTDYLSKPVSRSQLLQTITQHYFPSPTRVR